MVVGRHVGRYTGRHAGRYTTYKGGREAYIHLGITRVYEELDTRVYLRVRDVHTWVYLRV